MRALCAQNTTVNDLVRGSLCHLCGTLSSVDPFSAGNNTPQAGQRCPPLTGQPPPVSVVSVVPLGSTRRREGGGDEERGERGERGRLEPGRIRVGGVGATGREVVDLENLRVFMYTYKIYNSDRKRNSKFINKNFHILV